MKEILILITFAFSIEVAIGQDIKVPQDYQLIQEALDNATNGAKIIVAPGIYMENLIWPEDTDGIQLLGEMGSDSTIIDGNDLGRVLYKDKYIDTGSIIQGFTLRNGKSNVGAGLLIEGRGTDLIDLNIRQNETSGNTHCDGGGVRLADYSGLIQDCRIIGNKGSGGWTSYGGGISIELKGDIDIRDTRISGNTSKGGNSASSAGMTIDGFSHTITMTNVSVTGNRNIHDQYGFTPGAAITGGKIIIDSCQFTGNNNGSATDSRGGGLSISTEEGSITNSVFSGNSSEEGAGLRISGEENNISISNVTIDNNFGDRAVFLDCTGSQINFENCLITRNRGYSIFVDSGFNGSFNWIMLNHVTIANNNEGIYTQNSRFDISNSILWDYLNSSFQINSQNLPPENVRSSIVKGGLSSGNLILDKDPLLDPDSFVPGYKSPATGYANPSFSPSNSINQVNRPTPINTLPDLGAIETNQALSYADVRFFFDIDKDGLKNNEDFNLAIGGVKYQDVIYANFDQEGISLSLPMGMNLMDYEALLNTNWSLTTDQTLSRNIIDSSFYEELLFGLTPINNTTNINTFISMEAFRCDEYIDGSVLVSNEFTLLDEIYVWLQIDERIEEITFQIEPDITTTNHLVGWKLSDLKPTLDYKIDFNLRVPGITDPDQLNENYYFKSWCENYEDISEHLFSPKIRCSYDPNDKSVNPSRADGLALNSTSLDYTIRFQNTGNDYAKDITILDTLSTKVNPLTFKYNISSHPDNLTISKLSDYIVKFEFKDVFLIDSLTNAELSQGFVSYTVSPLEDLEVDTEIKNTAYIIFDSNPAIVTNTVITTIVHELPTKIFEWQNEELNFYPNPTNGEIVFSAAPDRIEIIDLAGRVLINELGSRTMNISRLAPGVYYIRMTKDDYIFKRQLIKN